MPMDAPTAFVLFWFLAAPLFWMGVCSLLAWMAGHPRLLRHFPPVTDDVLGFSTPLASGRGPWMVRFNNALTVRVGERGLHLAPNGLFRPPWWWGIPCIPWSELVYAGEQSLLFIKGHKIEIPAADMRWTLYGSAGEAVARALVQRGRLSGLVGGGGG